MPESHHIDLELLIGGNFSVRCEQNSRGLFADPRGSQPAGVNYTALTKKDCNLPERDNTMSVEFIITEELKNLNITCYDGKAERYSNSSLVIRDTKCEYTLIKYPIAYASAPKRGSHASTLSSDDYINFDCLKCK